MHFQPPLASDLHNKHGFYKNQRSPSDAQGAATDMMCSDVDLLVLGVGAFTGACLDARLVHEQWCKLGDVVTFSSRDEG